MSKTLKKIVLYSFIVSTIHVLLTKAQRGRKNSHTRIVNGVDATPNEFPWQAVLKGIETPIFCSGSLVSNQWVVTAAHCVHRFPPPILRVVLGDHDISTSDAISKQFRVIEIVSHPDYNSSTYDSDIALLKLSRVITEFTTEIAPISIPTASEISSLRLFGRITVSGWGLTSEGGFISNILQKVRLWYVPSFFCRYFTFYDSSSITNNMVCAGGLYKDSCQADSGGPLTYEKRGVTYLIGVVSWGEGCARFLYPGVYTKVVKFNAWINDNIN